MKPSAMDIVTYLGIISALWIISSSAAADPELSPENVTDANGNFADKESNITWAPLPTGTPYSTTGAESDGFLEPYLDVMRFFTHILQPNDIDFELVVNMYNSTVSLAEGAKELGMFMIGFGICVVIGILFLLIFPIVGCCFCCCRLCGKCGGKRIQKEPKDCKCIAFTIVMDILVAGQLMGALLLMMVSDRMGYSLGYLGNATESNLNDMTIFLNNTQQQVTFVAADGFNFTRDVIVRDLDSRGYLLGVKVRDDLLDYLNLNQFMTDIQTMETKVNDVYNAFTNLDNANSKFNSTYDALNAALNVITTTLASGTHLAHSGCTSDTVCNTLYTGDFQKLVMNPIADPSNVPNLTDSLSSLKSLKDQNISETAESGMQTFQDIPWTVQNDTQSEVDQLKSQLDSFVGTINKSLDSMNQLSGSSGSISGIQDDIKTYTGYLTDYDSYRSAAFWGFAFLTLICPILWLFGICIGPCCYNGKTNPKERKCCSNCAGIFLMAGAGCSWMLSLLIMLFVLLPFMIGYPLEKILCDTITDPEYKAFKYIFDGPGSMLKSDGYFLSEMIFQNKSINLTVSGVLESCKNNETAYNALKLNNIINLDEITDYRSQINISEQLNNMQTNFSDVELMSQTTEDQLREFSNASNVNFTAFKEIYSQSLLKTDLQTFITDLRNAANGISDPPKAELLAEATKLENLLSGEYNLAIQDQSYCLSNTTEAENQAGTIPTVVNDTINSANDAEQRLQSGNVSTIFTNAILAYQNRLLKVIDSFVNYILNNFKNEMAKCTPVWNLWDSLILTGMCSLTVDSFNAFWFTLGMSLFSSFLSIIFSIKLAKYFRQMKYDENDENPQNADDKYGGEPEVVDNDNAYNYNGGMAKKNTPGSDPFVSAGRPPPGGGSKNMGYSPPPPY